jgi:hypothetical protein
MEVYFPQLFEHIQENDEDMFKPHSGEELRKRESERKEHMRKSIEEAEGEAELNEIAKEILPELSPGNIMNVLSEIGYDVDDELREILITGLENLGVHLDEHKEILMYMWGMI